MKKTNLLNYIMQSKHAYLISKPRILKVLRIKQFFSKLSLWVLFGFFTSTVLAIPVPISSAVNRIINNVDPNINISMSVLDLTTGQQLYQRNSNNALIPASNMKLFSGAATLIALGPEYRFQRQLTTDATELNQGILNGSLYLMLPGDPSFTHQDLKMLLSSLSEWGIKQITGNVVLVNQNAGIDPYPPGRDPHDITHSYGAPITPLIIDENSLSFIVNPGHNSSELAIVNVNAPNGVIAINNTAKTSTNPNQCAIGYKLDQENVLTISGAIGPSSGALESRLAILNPLRYAQNLIKSELAEQHITLNGDVIPGDTPHSNVVLSSQYSKPLSQLMAETLKPSDNVYADSLFIHTASFLNGSPINWMQANTIAKQFLQEQTGINLTNAVLLDGSGLSKQDRLTAQQTVDLLSYVHSHFPIAYEFIAALPISGQDGTLQRRFGKPSQQGQVRAKTGTMAMTGALSLAGYLSSANGHTLAFAIYINRKPNTSSNVSGRYRWLIDQLCEYFLQQKPGSGISFHNKSAHSRVAFQQRPSQASNQRSKQARWRGLELALRKELRGKMVTVVYQPDQMILKDNQPDINSVWDALVNVSKRYPFSLTVESLQSPGIRQQPHLLWIKKSDQPQETNRTWILHRTAT